MPVLITDPADFEFVAFGFGGGRAFKLARSYAADQMRIVQSGAEREDQSRRGLPKMLPGACAPPRRAKPEPFLI